MDHLYKATESVVARKIAGETLLIPVTSHLADLQSIYALDEISSLVWSLLDGEHTMSKIIDAVLDQYDVSREVAEADVNRFIDNLMERTLVVKK